MKNWLTHVLEPLGFDPNGHVKALEEWTKEAHEAQAARNKAQEAAQDAAWQRANNNYTDTASSPIDPSKLPLFQSLPEVVNSVSNQMAAVPPPLTQFTNTTQTPATVAQNTLDSEPKFHSTVRRYGNGCVPELKELLHKASINLAATGIKNQTCLHIAASINDQDLKPIALVTFLLMTQPSLINSQNDEGNTAAHLTLMPAHFNSELLNKFLEAKTIDINLVNQRKQSLLHLAIAYTPAKQSQESSSQIAAATEIAKLLIAKGANLELQNERGQTALHLAIQYGKTEIIKLLLDKKASVNVADQEGNKPIHYAVCYTQPETIKDLKSAGADFTATNNLGQTALHYAIMMWNADWKEKKSSSFDVLRFWTSRDAQTTVEETVETLLNQASLTLNSKDQYGWTPLHWACATQHIDQDKSYMITLLKKKGAHLNATDKEGNTPFMTAIMFGMPMEVPEEKNLEKLIPLAKHLLPRDKGKRQTHIQIDNGTGNTALHFATIIRSKYQVKTIEYLLKYGANPFKKNKNGYSAYDLVVAIPTKIHDLTNAEQGFLKTIREKFEQHAEYKDTIKAEIVHAGAGPDCLLPESLQNYSLPHYSLPKKLPEEEGISETTPTQATISDAAFFKQVKRRSLGHRTSSSVATDASSAWTQVEIPPSQASTTSLLEIINTPNNSIAELPAEPVSSTPGFGKG